MRRVLIGGKLGLHGVATGAAKLRRLHVLDRPISNLSPHEDVDQRDYAQEPCDAPQSSFAIKTRFRQTLANFPLTKEESNGHQHQSCKEDQRKYEKDHDSNVGIVYVPADLQWQHKQPRDDRSRKKSDPQQTYPMPSQQEPCGPFSCVVHSVLEAQKSTES